MSKAAFDETIHPANRLQICAMQQAGYVTVTKKTSHSRPRTWLSLTPTGRKALAGHLAALQRIADLAASGPS